jgi:hypothetical protein
MKHYGVLTYYNSDDGVWLVCSTTPNSTQPMCWETLLPDYFGSLDAANEAWNAHLRDAHPEELE